MYVNDGACRGMTCDIGKSGDTLTGTLCMTIIIVQWMDSMTSDDLRITEALEDAPPKFKAS